MTALLLMAIVIYGNLVLTGVVEEKSSRVVEVLLARMPARNLLAGKVAGIGLLGLAQFAVTALAALVATTVVDSVDVPAVERRRARLGGGVVRARLRPLRHGVRRARLARVTDRGRAERRRARSATCWSRLLGLVPRGQRRPRRAAGPGCSRCFPATAPLAMPGRIALGAATWWEPLVAVALTLAAIAGLVVFAGRVYTNAILHTGPTLRLRDAWHSDDTSAVIDAIGRAPAVGSTRRTTPTHHGPANQIPVAARGVRRCQLTPTTLGCQLPPTTPAGTPSLSSSARWLPR